MPAPDRLTTVYASDEDIAVRAAGDFSILCPDWQKLAAGADGSFAPGAPWSLASPTVDFAAAGVKAQHVVILRKPTVAFKGSGELLAVDSAEAGSVRLRRLGSGPMLGQPPAPAAGLVGVDFVIASLDPQIEEASFELNRRLGIDPKVPGRTPGEVYDLRDLRQACVLTVLSRRYAAEMRGEGGDFAVKLQQVSRELSEVLARLQLRWGAGGAETQSTNWFSTRLVR